MSKVSSDFSLGVFVVVDGRDFGRAKDLIRTMGLNQLLLDEIKSAVEEYVKYTVEDETGKAPTSVSVHVEPESIMGGLRLHEAYMAIPEKVVGLLNAMKKDLTKEELDELEYYVSEYAHADRDEKWDLVADLAEELHITKMQARGLLMHMCEANEPERYC